ncbi:MAG: hypothetical protein IPH08_03490 [Rhodocyclaceae bacterium]|nr:hypothetical protein [Rhodocyclaceae bacterium]
MSRNSNRQWHGALPRTPNCWAEAYLAMTRGQNSLAMDFTGTRHRDQAKCAARPSVRLLKATPEELADHQRVLAEVAGESKGKCPWQTLEPATAGH